MRFTPLHKALGLEPSEELTNDILDRAVEAGVSESEGLDWKQKLPEVRSLSEGDVKKDIAAMANSGGGMIVYGVEESQARATGRCDAGACDERYESTYRRVAINKISPPVFGLKFDHLGDEKRGISIEIPASSNVPHLVQYKERFGAPVRNGSDTVWMNERQIEAMYRTRFDERRRAAESLDGYYAEAAEQVGSSDRPWLIAVAHPRIPDVLARPTRDDARKMFEHAASHVTKLVDRRGTHVLETTDTHNPRPGLRRWTAADHTRDSSRPWCGSWASVHHDGSASVVGPIGGRRTGEDSRCEPHEVVQWELENAVSDLSALIHAGHKVLGHKEYDMRIGIEWHGPDPLRILELGWDGHVYEGRSIPLRRYSPVTTTMTPAVSQADFQRQVRMLAEDCINQGGLTELIVVKEPGGLES